MKFLSIIILLIWSHNSLISQYDEVFSNQIVIEKDCDEEIIKGVLEIWGSYENSTKIFNLRSDLCEIEFFSNDNKIGTQDTLKTTPGEELTIHFRFKNYTSENKEVRFSTPYKEENVVQINLGSFHVSHEEVKSGKTKSINIKNNCSDSIRVYFPIGGTVTSALSSDKCLVGFDSSLGLIKAEIHEFSELNEWFSNDEKS